ncbi:MAG: hypothetical protein CR954_00040 [Candidatus Moraniibacteriota bacterium]|nr:MAG: hypothetical protein CR954_00040 [Candidatus Moranbacteria bacterium]
MLQQFSIQKIITTSISVLLPLFFVLFLWRFWTYGTQAIGFNIAVFYVLLICLFVCARWRNMRPTALLWIVPLVVVGFSLFMYKTFFTTWISLLCFPLFFFLFTTHEAHPQLQKNLWSRLFPIAFLVACAHYLVSLFCKPRANASASRAISLKAKWDKKTQNIVFQVGVGIVVLFLLAFFVIIPLLSSADASFGQIFTHFFEAMQHFFDTILDFVANLDVVTLLKLLTYLILFLALSGLVVYWGKNISAIAPKRAVRTHKNTITISIILIGILVLYVLFLFLQVKSLFISALPVDFSQTESMVKSGFWQLFFLTVFNILLYLAIFNKSAKHVQYILLAFTVSSLLLVFSAAQRVCLYVTTYGLSYEKFFALYTVIYCSIVFLWFLFLFMHKSNSTQIIKTLVFLAVGMYAFAVILPLEKIIFTTNLRLTQYSDSRVDINEMRMLGSDALPYVEENFDLLIAEARKDNARNRVDRGWHGEILETYNDPYRMWLRWMKEQQDYKNMLVRSHYQFEAQYAGEDVKGKYEKKKWYEKTVTEMFYQCSIGMHKKLQQTILGYWEDPIHGFSVEYDMKLHVAYEDFDYIEDFKKDEWSMYITDEESEEELTIRVYKHNSTEKISRDDLTVPEFLANEKEEHIKHQSNNFNLPHIPKHTTYRYSTVVKKGDRYGLIIDAPQGIIVIYSNTVQDDDFVGNWDLTIDDYIKKIVTSKKLQDVIKSLQFVDVK